MEYGCVVQNRDVLCCALSQLTFFFFFYRWNIAGEPALDFSCREV